MTVVPPGFVPIELRAGSGPAVALLARAESPVAAVLAELGINTGDLGDQHNPFGSTVGGDKVQLFAGATPISDEDLNEPVAMALAPGTCLSSNPQPSTVPNSAAVVEVSVVSGLDAGRVIELDPGTHRLPTGALLRVGGDPNQRSPWSETVARTETLVGDRGQALVVGPLVDPEVSRSERFRRPPRPEPAAVPEPIEAPASPDRVRDPPKFSWATVLGPIPIGLIMALFFRPMFLLFTIMGPVVAVARWVEGRRQVRAETARRHQTIAAGVGQLHRMRARQSEQTATLRWSLHPHVGELWRRARSGSVRTWERRIGDPDRLSVSVGIGPDRVSPTWSSTPAKDFGTDVTQDLSLRMVPRIVDLVHATGIGLHGDTEAAIAVTRSIVLQLATMCGPADLRIGVLSARLECWEWLKWLPHLDERLLGGDPGDRVIDLGGRDAIVVVDDPEADIAALLRRAEPNEGLLRVIAIAPTPAELPAQCSSVVGVDGQGVLELGAIEALATGVSATTALRWAQSLAAVEDPEDAPGDTESVAYAGSLVEALAHTGPESLRASWNMACSDPDHAPFLLGSDAAGLYYLDLVADGPHALVAGTTGSGKSELLRTMVVSLAALSPPEQLNLVLVDFKGGGAFDGCAQLPHVVGFITDLDTDLIERAIGALHTELRDREVLAQSGQVPPRLVIVIDEFAVLASDHPQLLDGIIDLSARGRSLGMHLVLATQKPSGVVDQRIRANTNLRIALRVQNDHESTDVIGVKDAALLDRRRPGQAIVCIGSDEPHRIQVCATQPIDPSGEPADIVRPFHLAEPGPGSALARLWDRDRAGASGHSADRGDPLAGGIERVSPLELIAADICKATDPGVSSRRLWSDPLPSRISPDELEAVMASLSAASACDAASPVDDRLTLGLVDLPHDRSYERFVWGPESGGMVVVCADPTPIMQIAASAMAASVNAQGPIEHIYVVAQDPELSHRWAGFGAVGAIIEPTDSERVERLVAHAEATAAESNSAETLIVIADIGSVVSVFDDLARIGLLDRLESLARSGSAGGVHLVLGARTARDLPQRLAQHFSLKLLGQVADSSTHLLLGGSRSLPQPASVMQLVDLASEHRIVVADAGESSELLDHSKSPAPPIRRCPTVLGAKTLPPCAVDESSLDIAIGVRYDTLETAWLSIRRHENALIAGPSGSGRSTVLSTCLNRLTASGVTVATLGPAPPAAPSVSAGMVALQPDQLDDFVTDAVWPTVVVIDDIEFLGPEYERSARALLEQMTPSVVVIASSSVDAARVARSTASLLRRDGLGVLLGANVLDGDIFRVRQRTTPGVGAVPGRATLIRSGRAREMHCATIL